MTDDQRTARAPRRAGAAAGAGAAEGLVAVVAGHLEDFLAHLELERGRSPHTVRAYRGDLTSLLVGVADLGELDLGVLRGWLAAQHAAGAGRSTLARRAAAARTFTAWARRTALIATDPGSRLVSPRPRPALPAVPDTEQTAAVLDAAGSGAAEGDPIALRDLLVLELLYATGVRVGELCGLDVDDVDDGRRALRVVGKGDRERTVVYGVPAGRALRRWLDGGRPALARSGSPPALLLGARGGSARPEGRPDRGAPRSVGRARSPRHRTARAATRRGDTHGRGRRGLALRTGVARSR